MIELRSLNKFFNKGKKNEIHVLNDVSLSLPEKGLVVILGSSGSGKTTLLNVIGGLDKVGSGSITYKNQEISRFNVTKWDELRNETIGYIFQNYYLQPQLSVYDNIAFVLKMIGIKDDEEIDKRVTYVLKALGMYEYRKKKALQLSGGQQQRVAIARALVKNPDIIIADEPTGNLDSKNTTEIMNIIQKISKEKLVVLVTHEKELADFYANRIIQIVDGKIVNDYENIQSEHHGLQDDQIIYLKDLENNTGVSSEHLETNLYSDQPIKDKIKVDLVYKNNTLYLKVDSSIKNIKLTNENESIKLVNEHYVKKTREELSKTSYDVSILDHSHLPKENKIKISAKRNIKLALSRVLSFGRKGKLMLASFILAGSVIAFSLAILFSGLIINPATSYPKDTIEVYVEDSYLIQHSLDTYYTYGQFMERIDSNRFLIKQGKNGTFHLATVSFIIPGFESTKSVAPEGNILFKENFNDKDLKYGTMTQSKDEVIISLTIAQQLLNIESGFFGQINYSGNDLGVWTIKDLFKEKFTLDINGKSVEVKVSGVSNEETMAIYINEELYNDVLTLHGLNSREQAYTGAYSIIVFANNGQTLIDRFNDNVKIKDIYQDAYDSAKRNNEMMLPTILPIVIIFLSFTFLGFYFVIRSSMISRIQEIGIYRALGVKRLEIISMFFFEIIVLTTVSTLIGYLLGFRLVKLLSSGILGLLNVFGINAFSFMLGLIAVYAFNLFAGLLPVFGLLRKTPAQILTQYDI